MKILFIQTGGSIDKDYPAGKDNHGYSFKIEDPAYDRILGRANPSFEFETKTVLRKDSLDITDDNRKLILEVCENTDINKIVITHGTDTIIKTAELLSRVNGKTIVLTGAFSPELFKNSDADFNLGTAVGAVGVLPNGVYIAMNGEVLRWDDAVVDADTGRFVSRSG